MLGGKGTNLSSEAKKSSLSGYHLVKTDTGEGASRVHIWGKGVPGRGAQPLWENSR